MKFDFPRDWEIGGPGDSELPSHHFSVVTSFADALPLTLTVRTQRHSWRGSFNRGSADLHHANDGPYGTPSPDRLLVVASFAGYFVSSSEPRSWLALDFPVIELRSAYDDNLVVLADQHRLRGLGPRGIDWTTARLSYDGIRLGAVSGGVIDGFGWDAAVDRESRFEVSLVDGSHVGGAAPDEQPVWVNPNARKRKAR